jgi:hypothetical protein
VIAGCEAPPGGTGGGEISPVNVGTGSGLASYKNRKLGEVTPYSDARRWESYVIVSDLADRVWRGARSSAVIASGTTNTFPGYPHLILEDRDNDGLAEFYAYQRNTTDGATREFGAYFDLSGDGLPDWIVFNGGPLATKDLKEIYWFTHQAADRDGDGRIDVYIVNAIDMDGDGFPESDATAWVYDDNGDGRVDRAENIVNGIVTPVRPQDGRLPVRNIFHQTRDEEPRVGEDIGLTFFEEIQRDILTVGGS